MRILAAAFLLLGTPALAQTVNPPVNGRPLTGAVDAPKATTSGNERATSDAAGVPQGTVGAGAASPGSDTNATAATARRHHHRAKPR